MEEWISCPVSWESLRTYGGISGLTQRVRALVCDGIEAIWGGDDALETQKDGVDYIVETLRRHGEFCRWVRGVHLHHSLSGPYVREQLACGVAEDRGAYLDRYARNYAHILRIDQHLPWPDPAVRRLFDVIQPDYLTHELQAATWEARLAAVARQRRALGRSSPTEI